MVEKRFEKLGMPDIERFENYLPTAFNSELTLLQKVNKIIFDLIETNKLTNEMVDYLNKFIEKFDGKLYKTVEDVLKVWLDDGLLADIVREAINDEVIEARTDYLGKKYVNLKERLDSEKAEVTAQLAQIATYVLPTLSGDDTERINLILENNDIIVFKKGVYNIDASIGVKVPSNKVIKFEKGAILKCLPNNLATYKILDLENCSNTDIYDVEIIGDRDTHTGSTGEWGMGVNLVNTSNTRLIRPKVSKTWGDGYYISGVTNVEIIDPLSDNCRRNGLSVISCDGLLIRNPEMRNMQGIEPETGIDLEPNLANERIVNLTIENPYLHHNMGNGLDVLGKTTDPEQWKNVLITNIISQFNDTGMRYESGRDIKVIVGSLSHNKNYGLEFARDINDVNFTKIDIFDNGKRGIGAGLQAQNMKSGNWIFDLCKIYNNSQLESNLYDGARFDSDSDAFPLDNVKFIECDIYDDQPVKSQRYGLTLGSEQRVTNFSFTGRLKTGATGKYIVNNRSSIENGKLTFSKPLLVPVIAGNSRNYIDIPQDGITSGSLVFARPEGDLENGLMWNAIAKTNSIRLFIGNVRVESLTPIQRNWTFTVINS